MSHPLPQCGEKFCPATTVVRRLVLAKSSRTSPTSFVIIQQHFMTSGKLNFACTRFRHFTFTSSIAITRSRDTTPPHNSFERSPTMTPFRNALEAALKRFSKSSNSKKAALQIVHPPIDQKIGRPQQLTFKRARWRDIAHQQIDNRAARPVRSCTGWFCVRDGPARAAAGAAFRSLWRKVRAMAVCTEHRLGRPPPARV